MVPDLDDCAKHLDHLYETSKTKKDLSAIYYFLKKTIADLKKKDLTNNNFKEIFMLLSAISCHIYDELRRREIE